MYDCTIIIIIDEDVSKEYDTLATKFKLQDKNSEDHIAGGMVSGSMDKYYLLLSKSYLTYNTIVHEIFHLASNVADERGINDEESKAWIAGHLAETIFKTISKNKLQVKHA